MKQLNGKEIYSIWQDLCVPILTAVIGLILVIWPDSALIMLSSFLGWTLIIGALVLGIFAFSGRMNGLLLTALVLLLGGILMTVFPTALASFIGSVLGIILLVYGGEGLWTAWRLRQAGFPFWREGIFPAVTAAIGLVLVAVPLSASRLVLRICGAVLILVGIVNLIGRRNWKNQRDSGGKPPIIDADV